MLHQCPEGVHRQKTEGLDLQKQICMLSEKGKRLEKTHVKKKGVDNFFYFNEKFGIFHFILFFIVAGKLFQCSL